MALGGTIFHIHPRADLGGYRPMPGLDLWEKHVFFERILHVLHYVSAASLHTGAGVLPPVVPTEPASDPPCTPGPPSIMPNQ